MNSFITPFVGDMHRMVVAGDYANIVTLRMVKNPPIITVVRENGGFDLVVFRGQYSAGTVDTIVSMDKTAQFKVLCNNNHYRMKVYYDCTYRYRENRFYLNKSGA